MKARTKALLLSLCAVLLVAVSVLGTVAFLKSEASVKNTFTVGKVNITLDEAAVDIYGNEIPTAQTRVKANEYRLIPGHAYTKDPTLHFLGGSEASYLFIRVENGLAAIEADTKIVDQIEGYGWTELEAGVYYKKVGANSGSTAVDYRIFDSFKLLDDADVASYENAQISVAAYAIQAEGFDTPESAWQEAGK